MCDIISNANYSVAKFMRFMLKSKKIQIMPMCMMTRKDYINVLKKLANNASCETKMPLRSISA